MKDYSFGRKKKSKVKLYFTLLIIIVITGSSAYACFKFPPREIKPTTVTYKIPISYN